jgi:hypothetical protein
MDEQMVPGDYTATGNLYIRSQMKTSPSTNIIGMYTNGVPFRVYEVYPEKDGILWGRVSSNTGEGQARYVGLRVNNNVKAHFEKAGEPQGANDGIGVLARAITELANSNTLLVTILRELVRK